MLVYYEIHKTMLEAIQREKRLKKWTPACAGMTKVIKKYNEKIQNLSFI